VREKERDDEISQGDIAHWKFSAKSEREREGGSAGDALQKVLEDEILGADLTHQSPFHQ